MVTTRSGQDHELVRAIALSKATAKAEKTHSKRLLGPRSRPKKTQATLPFSVVSQSSRARQKASSITKPKARQGSAKAKANSDAGRTPRSRTAQKTATSVLKKNSPVSEKKKRQVAEYVKRETDAARSANVVIKVGSYRAPAFKLAQVGRKKIYPNNFFSNTVRWKVGEQPFFTWLGPEVIVYRNVFDALKNHHESKKEHKEEVLKFDPTEKYLLPGHAYTGNAHEFNALIEPLLSCATSNNNQKLAAESLKRHLLYQNGQEGSVPNWHRLTDISENELAIILRPGGRMYQNAENIMALFYAVMEYNIQENHLSYAQAKKIHEEAKGAADYTDGLLALEFLVGLDMQQMFDKLVIYRGLGAKSAACVMCFSFNFAVFPVDTHVFRLAQWLGWVPQGCTRDDAFKFLTHVIPPELHRTLHQVFWHHGQLCFRCNGDTYDKVDNPKWKETICPLEQFGIDRFSIWKKQVSSNPEKEQTRKNTGADAEQWVIVPLKTDTDVADARAAGHEVLLGTMDDDASDAHLAPSNIKKTPKLSHKQRLPSLSNKKKTPKGFLRVTHSHAVAFKKFQKFQKLERKAKDLNGCVTVPLNTEKDVADARAAGYTVLEAVIDDAFGAQPELSNIKKNKKRYLSITHAHAAAFKQFQKSTVAAGAKASETNASKRKRGPVQQSISGLKVVKVQKTTTTKKKQVTVLELTTTTQTLAQEGAEEK
jgi:endonuclease III